MCETNTVYNAVSLPEKEEMMWREEKKKKQESHCFTEKVCKPDTR